jgi:hypothetical protein
LQGLNSSSFCLPSVGFVARSFVNCEVSVAFILMLVYGGQPRQACS